MVERLYEHAARRHLTEERQMLFLMGPRQVGKSTIGRELVAGWDGPHRVLNWDVDSDRRLLLSGAGTLAAHLGLDALSDRPLLCVLDEFHKRPRWKALLKGLFDQHADVVRLLVTGSARLDVFQAGGDSLMGRYFGYRMHPLSVAELADVTA